MRRRDPEPPPGPPRIEFKPGMANEMLREMAPLLAEEGIDVDNVPDIETLQRAMNRAVERHNMTLFTPVGDTREVACGAHIQPSGCEQAECWPGTLVSWSFVASLS
jgi:hypothetical protein